MTEGPVVLVKLVGFRAGNREDTGKDIAVIGGTVMVLLGDSGSSADTAMSILSGRGGGTGISARVGKSHVDPASRQARTILGYVSPKADFPPGVTPRSHLRLVSAAQGLNRKRLREVTEELLGWCSLAPSADLPARNLDSRGRFSLSLASALVANPEVLLMEGPVPHGMLSRLEDLRSSGRAIILRALEIGQIPPSAGRVALCDADGIAAIVRRTDLEVACRNHLRVEVRFYPSLPRQVLEEMPGITGLVSTEEGFSFRHQSASVALTHLVSISRANARSIVGLSIHPPPTDVLLSYFTDLEQQGELFDESVTE
ncbi:hypothetical protein GF402_06390 [Candidatus Fermentibacteria bacterium]|nr:hypothetical protein [Candidatus Fermentibacteria bacterium]